MHVPATSSALKRMFSLVAGGHKRIYGTSCLPLANGSKYRRLVSQHGVLAMHASFGLGSGVRLVNYEACFTQAASSATQATGAVGGQEWSASCAANECAASCEEVVSSPALFMAGHDGRSRRTSLVARLAISIGRYPTASR